MNIKKGVISIKILPRIIGVAGGLLSIILWTIFNFFNPYSNQIEVDPALIMFFMILLPAVLAIIASITSKPSWVLIAFIWATPYSLYLVLTPGIFALFGISCMFYLLSFLMIRLPITKH